MIVMIPMLVINGIFILFMRSSEKQKQENELMGVMARTEYEFSQKIADAVSVPDYQCDR